MNIQKNAMIMTLVRDENYHNDLIPCFTGCVRVVFQPVLQLAYAMRN